MRYLVNIKYDGTLFFGSAIQKDKRTINGELEKVLSKILNEKIKIIACSRTDKGVHAFNYFFHFDTTKIIDKKKILKSLNSLINNEIYIKSIEEVNDNFHARFNVKNKEYIYIINTGEYSPTKRNIELQYNKKINKSLIKKASKFLQGTHDFRSFTSDNEKENYVRTINYIKIKQKKEKLIIKINADGFLKYMVRNIIGLFLELNEGKKILEEIPNILESKNRQYLGIKAPGVGLYLNKVNYKR